MAGVQVPISYPTNTVDLQRAIGILKQSETATEKLRESTKKLGSDTSSTLAGMNQRLAQLRAQIELTSKSNTGQLQKLSSEYKALQLEIDKTNKKLFEQNALAKQSAQNWNSMYNSVRLFITAGLVRELTDAVIGMAALRGNLEGVTNAFNKLQNAPLLLQNLRRATHGTVDDLNLMQQALRAQNFRIPLQNLGTLLEFAATRAQQTGQEVQHLIDYIVSGIGLRSIRRLDDLGFTANRVKQALGGVTLQAASMGQVMDAVTKLMNEDLQQTGGYLHTAKTDVEQLNKNLITFRQTIAQKLDTSGIVGFLADLVKALDFFTRAGGDPFLARTLIIQEQAALKASASVDKFVKSKENELKTQDEVQKAIDAEIVKQKELISNREKLIKGLEKQLVNEKSLLGFTKPREVKQNQSIKDEITAIQGRNLVTVEYIELLKKYVPLKEQANEAEDISEEELERRQKLIEDEFNRQQRLLAQQMRNEDELMEAIDRIIKSFKEHDIIIEEDTKETTEEILTGWREVFVRLKIGWEETGKKARSEQEQAAEVVNEIKKATSSIITDLVTTEIDSEVRGYEARINNARMYYDELIKLAGDNERAKVNLQKRRDDELKRLERQKGEAETRAAKRKVYLEAAMGVARAFADYSYPYSLIVAGLVAVSALAQINEINKAPRGYKKGVIGLKGAGSETSDSIPAMLSRNESVITAQATRDSYKTLHKIQSGKLNDRVMEKIIAGSITVVGSDDKYTAKKLDELIKITKANRPPDYVERAGMLYRVKDKGSKSKQYIRSKYGF